MSRRILEVATVALLVYIYIVGLRAAFAEGTVYYNPPKLIKQGTATTPVTSNGAVVVQVLVNGDGTFKVQKIVRSSNHDDDAAALEMAQTAQYQPATKNGKPVAAFYTYTLKFVVGGTGGTLASYTADVGAGRYTAARSELTAYLQSHPDDAQANTLLGTAEYFLSDYASAVAAFERAGTIPQQYASFAANAYAKASQSAISTKDGRLAIAYATKAKQLEPDAAMWNLLGNAQMAANDDASAVQSFEQARTLAANDSKMDAKERATITANLIAAYVDAGEIDKAAALLPELKTQDPSNNVALSHVVEFYARKATAARKSGNRAGAVTLYEKAASFGGPYATTMYTSASATLMEGVKPDWQGAKTEAYKALDIDPDFAHANLAVGIALVQLNNPKGAALYLQKAVSDAKASGDAEVAQKAHQLLAQIIGSGVGVDIAPANTTGLPRY